MKLPEIGIPGGGVCLRTGSLGLDILLGGGWKPGTINEIWGEPGSGKTTLAQHAACSVPEDGSCLWAVCGSEIPYRIADQTAVTFPANSEQAFERITAAALNGVSLIVVDNANGLVRQRELDGNPDYVPHPQREYKDELNLLKRACRKSGTIVLFLSRPRDKDRQPVRGTGISEKARDRVTLRIVHAHQDGSKEVEARVRGDSTVLKIGPRAGIDWASGMACVALQYGVAVRKGSWVEYDGTMFHGISEFATHIWASRKAAADLDSKIREIAGI